MTQRISTALKFASTAFAALWLLVPAQAFAACTSPVGNPGDIVYSSTSNTMAYCNGTGWIAMGQSATVAFGTLTTGDFCLATSSSQIACTTAAVNAASQISGILPAANGGTGVNNGVNTITLGSSFVTSGAYALTLTTTGATNVTLPTSGTLVNTGVTTLSSLVSIGTVTTGTWNAGVITVPYGGTGLATLTSGAIYKGNGTGAIGTSGLSDNGTIVSTSENFDLTSKAAVTEITNAGTTGTTVGKLAKLSSGAAVITATADTDGAVGVVTGGAGTTGSAQIAVDGQVSCVFDGATTAGDYVTISSTTAGDCHDAGATRPTTQMVGRVLTTNASGGTYAMTITLNGAGATALANLSDVTLTSPANNNILQYNGTKWINSPLTTSVAAAIAPSFSVNNGTGTQSVAGGTWTKMTMGTTSFDTINGWSGTNNRYTPTIAGKYVFNGAVACQSGTITQCSLSVYKNGVLTIIGTNITSTSDYTTTVTAILDMNGTTDYVELWGYANSAATMGYSAYSHHFDGALLAPLASGSIAGTGTTNYVPLWSSSTTLTNSAIAQNGSNIGIGTTSAGNALTVSGTIGNLFGSDYTTTGAQSDVAINTSSSVRYAGTAVTTFYGIAAGTNGQLLHLHNASSFALTLANQSATDTTAASRIITGTGVDLVMAANSSVQLQYDISASRWRVIGGSGGGIPAGTTGQVQFNSGSSTFAADAGLTWDNTNHRLGIGTTAPTTTLQVSTIGTGSPNVIVGIDPGPNSTNGSGVLNLVGKSAGTSSTASISANYYGGLVVTPAASDPTVTIGSASAVVGNTLGVYGKVAIGTTYIAAAAPANGMIVQGSVGIGTTAPVDILHVRSGASGVSRVDSNSKWIFENSASAMLEILTPATAQGGIRFGDGGVSTYGTVLYDHSVDKLYLGVTGNATTVTINSSGQMGIGTTNPTAPLTVQSSNPASGSIKIQSSSTGQYNNLAFAENNGAIRVALQKNDDNSFGMWTATGAAGSESYTERFLLDTAGNVAIGTSATWFPLWVVGNDTNAYASSSTSVDYPQDAHGTATIGIHNFGKTSGTAAYDFMSTTNTLGTWQAGWMAAVSNASGYTPTIVWGARSGSTAYSEWMRLDTSGHLGVGTTSPAYSVDSGVSGGVAGQTLHVYSVGSSVTAGASSGGISFGSGTAGQMAYYSGASAISATGNLTVSGSNIGIGTASPGTTLEVASTAATGQAIIRKASGGADNYVRTNFYNASGDYWQIAANPNATAASSILNFWSGSGGINVMTLLGSGNVGIGTPTPAGVGGTTLELATASYGSTFRIKDAGVTNADWDILASTNGSTSMFRIYNHGIGLDRFDLDTSGNLSISGALTQNSDARLKSNVTPLQDSLAKLDGIKGVTFNWKDPKMEQREQMGVIAQDVEKVFPQLVRTDDKGIKSVNYSALTAPLIEAIKQLKAMFDRQADRIAKLEAANENQAKAIDELRQQFEAYKKAHP